MYKESFELIWKLAQNEKVVKEILFTKKGFRVRWVSEKTLFHYTLIDDGGYNQLSVDSFLELYEICEERAKNN